MRFAGRNARQYYPTPALAATGNLLTVASCGLGIGEGSFKSSILSTKAASMASVKCRSCDRAADAGAYCSSCAAGIMAKAFNPVFRGRRKRGASPEPPRPSAQQRLFR